MEKQQRLSEYGCIKVNRLSYEFKIDGKKRCLPRWEGQGLILRNDDVIRIYDGDNGAKIYAIVTKHRDILGTYIANRDGSMIFSKEDGRAVDISRRVMEQVEKDSGSLYIDNDRFEPGSRDILAHSPKTSMKESAALGGLGFMAAGPLGFGLSSILSTAVCGVEAVKEYSEKNRLRNTYLKTSIERGGRL